MMMGRPFLIISILISIIFNVTESFGQSSKSTIQKEAIALAKVLEKNHYEPQPLNDALSIKIFNRFLQELDPHGIYFTDKEILELRPLALNIDDELKGSGWQFLPSITNIYKARLEVAEKTFTDILNKPFTYSPTEKISFGKNSDTTNFAESEKEYLSRWTRWLKYQTLWKLSTQDSGSHLTEELVREKLKIVEKREIKKMLEHPIGYENYMASLFFNAVTYCFDPHTLYLSKTDWENYESHLSTENLSFGIDLNEDEAGDIQIARLVPGGPAWKTNELHKGDKVVSLQWEGKEPIDLSGADIYEVEEMLTNSNHKKLEITVRKTNGLLKKVSLVKEKIRDDENIVKGFVLNGNERKIGYISLPGFYTEWENDNLNGNGCANDVAKEIIKLKAEGIDGLILDIRYNGGGSLKEGLSLAGIFIDEGPLFMLQKKDRKPILAKDLNRGTIYDGPLIVMINGQSASASEVLASTLQDFNRALIVGSNSYGKATGQVVIPLDTNYVFGQTNLRSYNSGFGYLTVTVEKLYRITGKSAQIKGVKPDVHLPDIYENSDYKEAKYKYALVYDTVTKKAAYMALKPLPVSSLSEKSSARLLQDKEFIRIKKIIDSPSMKERLNDLILEPKAFQQRVNEIIKWWDAAEDSEKGNQKIFVVDNTAADKEVLTIDSYGKEINEIILSNLSEDIYLKETFQIMNDLINLTK